MRGRTCCSQQLNAELLYLSRMYFLMIGRFSTVGSKGRTGGAVGGGARFGHLHGSWWGPSTPVFSQGGRLAGAELLAATEAEAGVATVTPAA